jgi:hypothetical protein
VFIYNPGDAPFAMAKVVCDQCHPTQVEGYLLSAHAWGPVATCADCHDVHGPRLARRSFTDNALCLHCHESRGFATEAAIEAHTFHPVDPEGTGASRCTGCHMPPLNRVDQEKGPHDHSLLTLPPITSNQAAEAGVSPAPANSCSGVVGCHDGSVITAPVFHVDDLQTNRLLQSLYESQYGVAERHPID